MGGLFDSLASLKYVGGFLLYCVYAVGMNILLGIINTHSLLGEATQSQLNDAVEELGAYSNLSQEEEAGPSTSKTGMWVLGYMLSVVSVVIVCQPLQIIPSNATYICVGPNLILFKMFWPTYLYLIYVIPKASLVFSR